MKERLLMKFNTLTLTNGDFNFTVNLSNFTNNVEFLNFLLKNIKLHNTLEFYFVSPKIVFIFKVTNKYIFVILFYSI